MAGLDKVTLGVRRKFGQKLQGEKFDTSKIHILVTLQVLPCPNYRSDRLDSFTYYFDIYLVPTCTKNFIFLAELSESLHTRLLDLTSSWCVRTLSSRTSPDVGRVPREGEGH